MSLLEYFGLFIICSAVVAVIGLFLLAEIGKSVGRANGRVHPLNNHIGDFNDGNIIDQSNPRFRGRPIPYNPKRRY